MKALLVSLVLVSYTFAPTKVQANENAGREFLMSCTYGVLAGALVGAATLAVEDNADDKLNRIAKGASLGLYTGIVLGAYVAYLLPAQLEKKARNPEELESREIYLDDDEAPDDIEDFDPQKYEFDDGYDYEEIEDTRRIIEMPRLVIHPVFENRKITGAGVQLRFRL